MPPPTPPIHFFRPNRPSPYIALWPKSAVLWDVDFSLNSPDIIEDTLEMPAAELHPPSGEPAYYLHPIHLSDDFPVRLLTAVQMVESSFHLAARDPNIRRWKDYFIFAGIYLGTFPITSWHDKRIGELFNKAAIAKPGATRKYLQAIYAMLQSEAVQNGPMSSKSVVSISNICSIPLIIAPSLERLPYLLRSLIDHSSKLLHNLISPLNQKTSENSAPWRME